ncbi:hypothetical protein CBOM_03839 [Ceraceosorus bombacis]|uniref:Uncharacterized protein n=1 Tax=Ceraceosorus bombacis TaxID=401625 RepID=A0A0P1BHB3_9BASI|nr:hypothetical protein CBOM_03839 [Ceraceosorus bombacis]
MAHTSDRSWVYQQPHLGSGASSSPYPDQNGANGYGTSDGSASNAPTRQQDQAYQQMSSPGPSGPEAGAQLSRAPTWAKSINFGGDFDLDSATSPSPSAGTNNDIAFQVQQRNAMNHVRQESYGNRGGFETGAAKRDSYNALGQAYSPGRVAAHARVTSGDSSHTPTAGSPGGSISPRFSLQGTPRQTSAAYNRASPQTPLASSMQRPSSKVMSGPLTRAQISPQHQQLHARLSQQQFPQHLWHNPPEWARGPMYPSSSADLYATPGAIEEVEQLSSSEPPFRGSAKNDNSRPSTAGSGDDDFGRKSAGFGQNGYGAGNSAKRASVLSFQTALSGSFAGSGMHTPNSLSEVGNPMDIAALDTMAPPQPWVSPPFGTSRSRSASPEDRLPGALPGGWNAGGNGWDIAPALPPKPPSVFSSPRERPMSISSSNKELPLEPRQDSSAALTLQSEPQAYDLKLDAYNPDADDTVIQVPGGAQGITREVTVTPAHSRSASRQLQKDGSDAKAPPQPSRNASFSAQEAATRPSMDVAQEMGTVAPDSNARAQQERDAPTPVAAARESELPLSPAQTPRGSASSRPELPPALPSKERTAPLLAKHSLPSTPVTAAAPHTSPQARGLADDVIPPPLPRDVAAPTQASAMPPVSESAPEPVTDFRARPLANITTNLAGVGARPPSAGSAGLLSGASQSPVASRQSLPTDEQFVMASQGAPPRSQGRQSPADLIAQPLARKQSAGNALPRAAFADAGLPASSADPVDRSTSPSIETPPREDSPPPEGEVEARAEWERARAKRLTAGASKEKTPRKPTFRGSLKPLQYMDAPATPIATYSPVASGGPTPMDSPLAELNDPLGAANAQVDGLPNTAGAKTTTRSRSGSSGGVLSTQQLQRQQARDQRRSVGTINLAMGTTGDAVGGASGPYPTFPSPSAAASNGGRLYSGVTPQRSLVPPFELQQRPDGLLSGLIGPDGVRRSPNDPEVCLECMMRDEDMIDVHVLGPGLWERESDRDFEDACRAEAEEDDKREARRNAASQGTHGGTVESVGNGQGSLLPSAHGSDHSAPATGSLPPSKDLSHTSQRPAGVRVRVKRVAKGDPLTAERLKLHTQMNPPASSHRWRTLQTFLAIQAKYIAAEQRARQQAGLDRELPSRPNAAPAAPGPITANDYDNRMIRTNSGTNTGDALVSRLSSKNSRSAQRPPGSHLKDSSFVLEDEVLAPADREAKERDIANARDARRKLAASAPDAARSSSPAPGARATHAQRGISHAQQRSLDEERKRASGQLLDDLSAGHQSIPRRSAAASSPTRVGSINDLRSLSGAMQATAPSSPVSLAPPNRPFVHGSGGRSQLSLAPSGSMVDMHVGLEDHAEHRINQAGFMPGTPLGPQSPGVLNRAYYGYPGDGEQPRSAMTAFGQEHADQEVSHQADATINSTYQDPNEADESRDQVPNEAMSRDGPSKRKSKKGGLRGFFSKIAGTDKNRSSSNGLETSSDRSGSPRAQRVSLGADAAIDQTPSTSRLSNRGRRSTSSLVPSGRPSGGDKNLSAASAMYQNPPGMASQTSFDMGIGPMTADTGPFGSGPLPPPRLESRTGKPVPASHVEASAASAKTDPKSLRSASSTSYLNNAGRDTRRDTRGSLNAPRVPLSPATASIASQAAPPKRTSSRGGASQRGEMDDVPGVDTAEAASVASSRTSRKDVPALPAPKSRQGINQPGLSDDRYPSGFSTYANNEGASAGVFSSSTSASQTDPPSRSSMQTGRGSGAATPLGQPSRPPRNPRRESPKKENAPLPSFNVIQSGSRHPQQILEHPLANSLKQVPPLPSERRFHTGPRAPGFEPMPPLPDFNPVGDYDAKPSRQHHALDLAEPMVKPGKEKRKSRFFKFSFGGKNKRESSQIPPSPSAPIADGRQSRAGGLGVPSSTSGGGLGSRLNASWVAPSLRSRSSRATFDEMSALPPPKPGFAERLRAVSTPADDRRDLPPRAQSSMAKLPSQGFAFPGFRSRSRAAMVDEDSDE